MIQSNGHFRYTTGYVEARVFLPGTTSKAENWSAWWSNGDRWPQDGEIDIMEVLDGSATWHYHWSGGSNGGRGNHISPENGWHTFGAYRQSNRIDFYYDGRLIGSQTQGMTNSPHYLILNHALSSEISPPVVVPSTMLVDYVRVFERVG